MSNQLRLYFRVMLIASFILSISVITSAQSKGNREVQDHTSNIVVSGTGEGTSVTFTGHSGFAGIITGTLNNVAQKFYCIDLNHTVNPSQHPTYWDEGTTPPEMTYILNNYFPFNTSNYAGKLSDINKEAASIQVAIWHFSDNVDISTITDATIKSRVTAIVNDALANSGNVQPLETLIIVPPAQSFVQGTNAHFDVYALDLNGSPYVGLNVSINSTLGTLSTSNGTTDANGKIGPVTLSYGGVGTATISAQATVQLPQGTIYVDKTDPTGKQRLVLATPTTDVKQVQATVEWYTKPADCDTKGYTTFTQGGWGSPSNSAPGQIRDQYFSTVFPSGLVVGNPSGNYHLKLTSATAVKNYLPDGGTAAAYTQNYSNPTSKINVLSGQLVALKLNVYFSAAGKLGSNTTPLGELIYASGPFAGMTVNQFLAMAETAIGGGSLGGFTLSQYNDAATSVNENFDNGSTDNGTLTCAHACENKIGSYVFHDLNANGVMDNGEAGIPNVVVELVQNNSVIATSTTDLNGKYSFANVPNGTYAVRIAASNFVSGGVFFNMAQIKWYTKNSTSVSTTLNCNDNLSINFGYYKTCIGITKTADKTTYKKGDVVTYTFKVENCGDITLHGGIDIYDQLLVPSGDHKLLHILLLYPGHDTTFTRTYTTSDKDCGSLTNNVEADGHPVDGSATVVSTSSVTVTVDCSVSCQSSIGDFVWHDKNHNGIQDSGEPGIPGVTVELVQNNTVIATAVTDQTGKYLFANLPNGTYYVRVAASNFLLGGALYTNDQTKWYASPKLQGSDRSKDSNAGLNESASVTINCADDLTIDFGFYKTCVSLTKTADKTSYKKGDTITFTFTIENCGDIQLHGGIDVYDQMLAGNNVLKHIDVLDAGATTSFTETYVTTDKDCGNITNTARAEGHPVDGSANVNSTSSVTVNVDCSQACKNTIGDFVWHDKNHNGIQDSGEPGIPGVIVEMVQNNTVIATTTTDQNGLYTFTNVVNGTYSVRVAASNFVLGGALYSNSQTKWYASPKLQGSDRSKDSNAGLNESADVTVNCNDDLTIDFGFYKTCVSITKTADKASYNKGETITYTFAVENCGDIQLHGGIDIYDQMLAGSNILKHIDVLDAGASTSFIGTYVTSDKDCGQITNTARAEGHPVDGSATVVDESSVTVTVVCQQSKADIKVEKVVDNTNPQCDGNVTYTIKVTNQGPNDATGIVVMDLLPAGLDYISSNPSQGTYNNTTGLWTVGSLINGGYATLTITAKVDCGTANNSTFDLGAAKDYNLFVINDLTQPSSDTQGKVAVGHNATLSTYSVGDKLPANSGDVLVVGNDLNYTSGAVYNGNVVYGHATNLPQSSVSITGGTLRKDNVIDFAAAKNSLQAMAVSLSAYTVNGTTSFQWGGLTLTGSDPYLNVFNVNGADLSLANSVSINVPNGAGVLVNISGTNVSWTGGLVVNGTAINNVLYNFYEATTLKIQGIDVKGSILAPFAAVNFISGVQNGQMVCYSLTGAGQFNYITFDGHIPYDNKITNIASVITSSPLDDNASNNTGSATITIGSTGNGGNNGGGNTGGGTGGNTGGNGNGNWQSVCSFGDGSIVYSLITDGTNIYAGTWGGKIYKSSDNGKSWILFNAGMNASFIWSLNISGGYIFAATEQGVFKYNGSAWVLTTLSGKDCHTITSYNGVLYAGTWGFGVYVSTDFGTTWTEMNTGFGYFLTIQALTVTSSGDVFAGTVGGGMFKLAHGTATWAKVGCGYVWSLGATSTAIFAGTYGDGLYRSMDNGGSWTKLTSLDITFVYSISVDASGKIYASSLTNGVEVSSDNGNSWTSFGLGGSGVSSLMVLPSTNTVFAGTKSGTLYASSEVSGTTGIVGNNSKPTEFSLSQNYPNPFNPTTTIEFAIPVAGKYSLKVYNILGQEIANLVDNELSTGIHNVTFDASRLASGMYIYRLIGNNVSMTKKMILMK